MIKIICVGKVKNNNLKDEIEEYIKNINNYIKMEIIELKGEKEPKKISKKEIGKILAKEEEKIIPKIGKEEHVIILDIEGKQYDSLGFSKNIINNLEIGKKLTFIIGGSNGLSDKIKQKGHQKVSLSSLTFTFSHTRLILFEQIYRAIMIKSNKRYHK